MDEDDEDAEFVDNYDQLLSRFTKVVCEAEKQQVMSDAVLVGKKKRRSGSTAGEEKKPKDGQKVADEEERGRSSTESGNDSDDSDPDPQHKPSRGFAERPEAVKERSRKDEQDRSMQPVWQDLCRCFSCNGLGHRARDCMANGKDKAYDSRNGFNGGKGRPSWNDGKGFVKGFGKDKKGKKGL